MPIPTHKERIGHAVSNTPGTAGAFTLSTAETGYLGLVAGDNTKAFDILAIEGTAWEVRRDCVYTSTGTSLARGTLVTSSTGSAISFTAAVKIYNAPSGFAAQSWEHAGIAIVPGGRLTLESGVPLSTASQTAKSTLYYTPHASGFIPLYDGARWQAINFVEALVAVPSTIYRQYDVFGYLSAGVLAIETLNWNQITGVVGGATNATPISISDTAHGLTTGDAVFIAGVGGNTRANGHWTITVTDANNYTLVGSTGNGTYTSGGLTYRLNETRATALTTQNGRLVKTGDATRLYLGTGCTGPTSGQTEDSAARRLLANFYNAVDRALLSSGGSSFTSVASAADRRYNNNDATVPIVEHVAAFAQRVMGYCTFRETRTGAINLSISTSGKNSMSAPAFTQVTAGTSSVEGITLSGICLDQVVAGYGFAALIYSDFQAVTYTIDGGRLRGSICV